MSKSFGGTRALADVDFGVAAGEIHALLGENGAGKSTLIKLVAGIHAADSGTLLGPHGALAPGRPPEGIAFVHQDLGLVGTMSVAENVALGPGYARRGPLIDWSRSRSAARRALGLIGLRIHPETPLGQLSPAERSLVAIARALVVDARVLVLDEPSATLPPPDVARLHDGLRRLRAQSLGIVYVTHRLDEVFSLADRVTVLRDGRVRHTGPVAGVSPSELVRHIIGRPPGEMFPDRHATGLQPVIEVEALRSKSVGPLTLRLHAGEILGFVGLRNSGQDTAGRLVAGVLPARSGGLRVLGEAVKPGSVPCAIAAGLGFVSSKRIEESLCLAMNLRENLFLDPLLARLRIINTRRERTLATDALRRFDVRPPEPDRTIATLSGGNQQKVAIARWLDVGRRALVLEEPTIGVDVGARAEIYRLIAEAALAGLGVIVVSSDFAEVAGLCHRALVFGRGAPVAELAGADLTVAAIADISGRAAA